MLHALALKLLLGDTLGHHLCVMDDWAGVGVEGVCCSMTVISATRRWSGLGVVKRPRAKWFLRVLCLRNAEMVRVGKKWDWT